jgi:hypothetical protein
MLPVPFPAAEPPGAARRRWSEVGTNAVLSFLKSRNCASAETVAVDGGATGRDGRGAWGQRYEILKFERTELPRAAGKIPGVEVGGC